MVARVGAAGVPPELAAAKSRNSGAARGTSFSSIRRAIVSEKPVARPPLPFPAHEPSQRLPVLRQATWELWAPPHQKAVPPSGVLRQRRRPRGAPAAPDWGGLRRFHGPLARPHSGR